MDLGLHLSYFCAGDLELCFRGFHVVLGHLVVFPGNQPFLVQLLLALEAALHPAVVVFRLVELGARPAQRRFLLGEVRLGIHDLKLLPARVRHCSFMLSSR